MVDKMKKFGLLSLVGLTLFATGCGCSKEKEKTEEKNGEAETVVNTAQDVVKDQTFEGLQMTNTSLTTTNGVSTLVTEVTNNTGADYYLNQFVITVKDSDGAVIETLPGYVGEVILNGETRVIHSSTDTDLSNANSIEYSVTK